MMAAMVSMNTNSFNCCSMAAAGTSAPMISILDTAIALVVSICILCLDIVRIILPDM